MKKFSCPRLKCTAPESYLIDVDSGSAPALIASKGLDTLFYTICGLPDFNI